MKIAIRILMLLVLTLGVACDDPGPLEQAGEEVDEAFEDAAAGGESMGNKVDDAVDDLREGAEEAKEEMQGE